jgi:hypothetical protein
LAIHSSLIPDLSTPAPAPIVRWRLESKDTVATARPTVRIRTPVGPSLLEPRQSYTLGLILLAAFDGSCAAGHF